MSTKGSIQTVTVLVPANPFVQESLQTVPQCLAALDVRKLMEWWPGTPHSPHRNPDKVRAIQRSLDWKRVVQIAAYLMQQEIIDAPARINKHFRKIYEPKSLEAGREWPPRVPKVVGFQKSAYPTFSNVLLHVNGARIEKSENMYGAAKLIFDEQDPALNFAVIDGQHRINGAYLAVCLMQEEKPGIRWEIPAEVFIDLDPSGEAPRRQAQIFIDVNFYQKKVDRSLVADLFPTARGPRGPLDNKERAQDLGRKLMLEIGPLVGMVQIPGIRFGVKDVVTLATLNSAIEDVLDYLDKGGVISLDAQAEFIAQCLEAWLEATGRKEEVEESHDLDPDNVAYQGRVVVSFLTLTPWCIWSLKKKGTALISSDAKKTLTDLLRKLMKRAGLLRNGRFLPKEQFKAKGYLGSGGLARFRDSLWAAAVGTKSTARLKGDALAQLAEINRNKTLTDLDKN
ncbi:MAG: DNA sulfur modification protein DndB [Anaerolineales bacterium]